MKLDQKTKAWLHAQYEVAQDMATPERLEGLISDEACFCDCMADLFTIRAAAHTKSSGRIPAAIEAIDITVSFIAMMRHRHLVAKGKVDE